MRHASRLFGTYSLVHAMGAAYIALHYGITLFHHHFMLATGPPGQFLTGHLADAACNKTNEKDESDYDKKPGNKGKEFARCVFLEFCKQQRARKNCQQRNS